MVIVVQTPCFLMDANVILLVHVAGHTDRFTIERRFCCLVAHQPAFGVFRSVVWLQPRAVAYNNIGLCCFNRTMFCLLEWVQDPLPVSPPEGTTHPEWPSFTPLPHTAGSASVTTPATQPSSEQPPWQTAAAAAISSDSKAAAVPLPPTLPSPLQAEAGCLRDGDEEHLHYYVVNGKTYDFSQLVLDEDPAVSAPSACSLPCGPFASWCPPSATLAQIQSIGRFHLVSRARLILLLADQAD